MNDRDKAYDVEVSVEDGGETAFSETYTLGTDVETSTRHEENPVDGPGRYVVTATVDGEALRVDTVDFVAGDEDCIGVRFSLLDGGMEERWVKSMQQC